MLKKIMILGLTTFSAGVFTAMAINHVRNKNQKNKITFTVDCGTMPPQAVTSLVEKAVEEFSAKQRMKYSS